MIPLRHLGALAGASAPFILAAVLPVAAADWPAWRGPAGNGSSPVGGLPTQWTAETLAWKQPLPGKGTSTPVVSRQRVYVTSPADGQDAVLAFDLAGKEVWRTKLGPESPPKHRTLASSGNASPVTDGTSLFVQFKSGTLAALGLDGSVRWKTNLVEKFGEERLFWDAGSSPVLTDRHLVVTRMHAGESWIAGFDQASGALAWRQLRSYRAPTENDNGYTTAAHFQHQGRPALLVWGADHLTAHAAADGTLLWWAGGFNPEATGYWPAIASPVIVGDIAVVPVGRDDRPGQARVHGIRLGGAGDVTATHRAWQRDDVGVFVTAPAVHDGRVYLLRHRGGIVCLDPATGRTAWEAELPRASAPFYASPVIAGGVLYAAREDGVVFAARVGEKFELLGESPLGERVVASPAPAAGHLFLRGDRHLFAVADRP